MYLKWLSGIFLVTMLATQLGTGKGFGETQGDPGACLPTVGTADSVRVATRTGGKVTVLAETAFGQPTPFIVKAAGRTMIPIGLIMRQLPDTKVTWDENVRAATFERHGRTVVFAFPPAVAEANKLIIDGVDLPPDLLMEVKAYICSGRIFVPLRFVGEALNFVVDWDAITKTAILDLDKHVQSTFDMLAIAGNTTNSRNGAIIPDGFSIIPVGCLSMSSLSFETGVPGGTETVRVYCTPDHFRDIKITVRLLARNLAPGAEFVAVGETSDECFRALLSCSVSMPFTATSDRARLYRLDDVIVVAGLPRVGVTRGPNQWVFRGDGLPYPEVWWPPIGYVPFPDYDGPWWPNMADDRNQGRFNDQCDALYAANGWDIALPPLGEDQYEHHHVHPLEVGGSQNGYTNCVILPGFLHDEFSIWWRSFYA
jgi:hypothetical protein